MRAQKLERSEDKSCQLLDKRGCKHILLAAATLAVAGVFPDPITAVGAVHLLQGFLAGVLSTSVLLAWNVAGTCPNISSLAMWALQLLKILLARVMRAGAQIAVNKVGAFPTILPLQWVQHNCRKAFVHE